MCSGTNPRQIQAIADAVDERLEALGLRVTHSEGYKQAEWVLLDYVDFVVHIFSEKARQFYDLERLVEVGQAAGAGGIDGEAEGAAGRRLRKPTAAAKTARSTSPKPRPRHPRRRARRRPEMCASNPAPWGSSFRLVAAEKWKAKSAMLGKRGHGSSGRILASVAGYACARSGQRHWRAWDQPGTARWSARFGHGGGSECGIA